MDRADGEVARTVAAAMADGLLVMNVLAGDRRSAELVLHLGPRGVALGALFYLRRLAVVAGVFGGVVTSFGHRWTIQKKALRAMGGRAYDMGAGVI